MFVYSHAVGVRYYLRWRYENLALKMKFFWCQGIIFDSDPEIGFLTKSISEPYDDATAMPRAREL